MKMNIFLIVLGVVLINIGIYRIISQNKTKQISESQSKIAVVEDETPIAEVYEDQEDKVYPTTTEESEEKSSKDLAKERGNAFEDFVCNLLSDWRLKLLDRTQDAVSSGGVVAESCKNPDLHVEQKRGEGKPIDYYLECKYRSNWKDGAVTFEDWQFDRYRKFQKDNKRKVLIALGVGGTPDNPKTFMIVPLDSIQDNTIKQIKTQYVVQPTSSSLIEYMNDYFTTVFDKAKERKKKS